MRNYLLSSLTFLNQIRPRVLKVKFIALLLSLILIYFGGKYFLDYLHEPLPKITLHTPKENEEVTTSDLYIRGLVSPLGSKVLVNGQNVSLNGDGTFTAIVKVKEGENTLLVIAEKRGKKAEFLRLVRRSLSPEEAKQKQEAEAKELAEARARVLSQDQETSQVQAAYTQREVKKVRVTSHELKGEYGLKRVVGKVVNDTDYPTYWVKVTTNFLDPQGQTVDSKIAFVTSFEKFLKPGEEATFETQTMDKEFDRYQLEVTWEKE